MCGSTGRRAAWILFTNLLSSKIGGRERVMDLISSFSLACSEVVIISLLPTLFAEFAGCYLLGSGLVLARNGFGVMGFKSKCQKGVVRVFKSNIFLSTFICVPLSPNISKHWWLITAVRCSTRAGHGDRAVYLAVSASPAQPNSWFPWGTPNVLPWHHLKPFTYQILSFFESR